MILDINGGNQTMWEYKDFKEILHIDMEKKLTIKPDIFCDNRQTPFRDKVFDTIFADPPHFFNDKGSFYAIPDKETFKEKWKGYGEVPRYYGGDKYKTKTDLLRYVSAEGKECYRILKDDGILWLKWNETYVSINTVMAFFDDWNILLELPIRLSNPNRTDAQTYWVCLCKKKLNSKQIQLT